MSDDVDDYAMRSLCLPCSVTIRRTPDGGSDASHPPPRPQKQDSSLWLFLQSFKRVVIVSRGTGCDDIFRANGVESVYAGEGISACKTWLAG